MQVLRMSVTTCCVLVGLLVLAVLIETPEAPVQAQQKTSFTAGVGTPTLDGVASPGEWTGDSVTTSRGVTIKAMIDPENFYVLAQWPDSTESIALNRWTFDGENWTAAGDEDRIGFVWDMKDEAGNSLNGEDGASCITMCHAPIMRTRNGRVDVWHWKAHRFNPMGRADDKYWDTCEACEDGGRHGDSGAGSGGRNRNAEQTGPVYMAASGPGANVDFLADTEEVLAAFDPFTVGAGKVEVKTEIGAATEFEAGAVVPGRILTIPSGNRASVHSAGKWSDGVWTVEFRRKLAGEVDGEEQPEDFRVVQGGSAQFTTDIFDNVAEHSQHALINGGADLTVYTLNFPYVSTLHFAQFADGEGLSSQIILYGISNGSEGEQTTATIILRDREGAPLTVDLNGQEVNGELEVIMPPSGVKSLKTDGAGELALGSVSIQGDRLVDGVIVYGGSLGLAGVTNSARLSNGFTAPMEVNTALAVDTGIAVMNLEEVPVTLNLQLGDQDGNILATAELQLPPNGQTAKFVTELEWSEVVDFGELVALLKATSTGDIAATVIQARLPPVPQPVQLATMPVTPN